jgi:hypothetical protein
MTICLVLHIILCCQLEREIAGISIVNLSLLEYYLNVYCGLAVVFLLIFK